MKKRNKILGLMVGAVALVGVSVMGTMAYLTDQETVNNTFTVGSVSLGDDSKKGLDEALVNEYGKPINNDTEKNEVNLADAPRVLTNDYKLVPDWKYVKDPTVHVKNDSEECYVFVKVDNGLSELEIVKETQDRKKIATQIIDNGWNVLQDDSGEAVAGVYWKKWSPEGKIGDFTDWEVFGSFSIDEEKTAAQIENVVKGVNKEDSSDDAKIVVTAYAVQTNGFSSAIGAWNDNFAGGTTTP